MQTAPLDSDTAGPPLPPPRVSGRAVCWLLALAVLVTAAPVGVALALPPTVPGPHAVAARGGPAPVAAAPRAEVGALAVLRDWDRRRARAWAAGEPRRLRPLYLAGSRAGARDRAMLRAWQRRGVRVIGLRTQVLAASVLAERPDRVVLRVTERLVGGRARPVPGAGFRPAVRLPASRPRQRVVVLRRLDGVWRVAAVGTPRRAAARGR